MNCEKLGPECHNISITFEPFNNLLVPLAKPKVNFNVMVMFHVFKRKSPVKLNIFINETSKISELYDTLCLKFNDLNANNVTLISILADQFSNFL